MRMELAPRGGMPGRAGAPSAARGVRRRCHAMGGLAVRGVRRRVGRAVLPSARDTGCWVWRLAQGAGREAAGCPSSLQQLPARASERWQGGGRVCDGNRGHAGGRARLLSLCLLSRCTLCSGGVAVCSCTAYKSIQYRSVLLSPYPPPAGRRVEPLSRRLSRQRLRIGFGAP